MRDVLSQSISVKDLSDRLVRLGAIGDSPGDGPDQLLRHRLIVYMGILMAQGGLVWGTLALFLESWLPAAIPYGYVVLTLLNLSYFYWSKNFPVARGVQVLISLLLPFLFQWSLGGFAASGGVMLWAVLALVGTHAFGSWKRSARWGLAFVGLTIVSGLVDAYMAIHFTRVVDETMRTGFFVVNIAMISSIMFSLTIWLMVQGEALSQRLQASTADVHRLNVGLEGTVRLRTEKLELTVAALGHANDQLKPLAKAWEEVWDPIEICDSNGHVIFVNPAFVKCSSQVVGEVSEIILQDEGLLPLLRSGSSGMTTRSTTDADTGQTREYQITLSPVPDDEGRLTRIVIIHRDITERLEHERDLMQRDRLTSLGTMAAGMAHEINNPLTYIQANLEQIQDVLLAPPGGPSPDLQSLRVMGDECLTGLGRIAEIVSTLQDVARPDQSTVGSFALGTFVESCLRVVEHEIPLKAQLEVVTPDEPVYVECNEAKLSQILINLLLNALAAMESSNAQSNRLSIRLRREQDTALIEVSDTGTGISKQILGKIFDPFFTTKPVGEGLGLGLAMSHRLITGMGGTIVPTSEIGVGSTFLVSLPAVVPPQPQAPVVEQANPGAMATGRILIIDDLPQLTRVLARILRRHDVTTTNTADEALKQLQDNEFDVVVCDIMMPGMTGLELRAAVQTIQPALADRFIFVTGGIFSEVDQESAHETGCLILEKPVHREKLLGAVQSLMTSGGIGNIKGVDLSLTDGQRVLDA